MAKFGKKLRTKMIEKWKENYINYKSLKNFIKENSNMCNKYNFIFIYH